MHKAVVVASTEAAGLVCMVVEAAAMVGDTCGDAVVVHGLAFDVAIDVVVVVVGCLCFLMLHCCVCIAITWACGISLILHLAVIQLGFGSLGCFGWFGQCSGK